MKGSFKGFVLYSINIIHLELKYLLVRFQGGFKWFVYILTPEQIKSAQILISPSTALALGWIFCP